jgi:hypothetical protein
MRYLAAFGVALIAIALGGCEKKETVVVPSSPPAKSPAPAPAPEKSTTVVPVPVPVPGPQGPAGEKGEKGEKGEPGRGGDTTIIVPPPADKK